MEGHFCVPRGTAGERETKEGKRFWRERPPRTPGRSCSHRSRLGVSNGPIGAVSLFLQIFTCLTCSAFRLDSKIKGRKVLDDQVFSGEDSHDSGRWDFLFECCTVGPKVWLTQVQLIHLHQWERAEGPLRRECHTWRSGKEAAVLSSCALCSLDVFKGYLIYYCAH